MAGMAIGTLALIPQANLTYSHVESDKYTEFGGDGLTVDPGKMDILHLTAGVALNTKFKQSDYTTALGARLMADWDATQDKAEGTASYPNATPIATTGAKPAAFGGIGGLSLDFASNDGSYGLTLGYEANVRSEFISHTGEIKFRKSF